MSKSSKPCESITVTVRNNEGVDSNYSVLSTEEASATVKQHAQNNNYMICVEIDGERTDRWDRERYKGENRWLRTAPDAFETLGKIREILRVSTKSKCLPA